MESKFDLELDCLSWKAISEVISNYGVTATCVQAQNHLEVKKYTPLPYMGINRAIRSKDFDAM
jgi:hypothetical protein